ncbi:hypothetical protein GGF49_001723 [Coemansia sp. RSA 1853]|nr:hypothetical protein GGF49_001723 [Coemansia sp. RSA 1853]
MDIDVSGTPEFTQLSHLDLNFKGEKSTQIPLACTNTLQHLVISQILVDHNWLAIDPNNLPSTINFDSLKSLHLTYFDDDPSDFVQTPIVCQKWMSHTKVHFPKLAHFYTNNDSDEFPILAISVFPHHIETLDIRAQTKLLRLLVLTTWPQTKHLKLTIPPSYNNMDASLFACIRHLFKSAEMSKTAELEIINNSLVVEQELFAGLRVTHLVLSPPVGFTNMVSLVDNMPDLVKLCVYDFVPSTVPDSIDCSDQVAPFSSKLQQLSIDCSEDEYSPVRTINEVVYMAKRLTQLKMVKLPISIISVVELLNKERDMYPHLNNMLFKFTEYIGYLDTRTLDIFGNNK